MRSTLTWTAAATVSLALAACGGSSGGRPAAAEDAAFDGAVKFARCMRDNGVDMPDPQRASGSSSSGAVRIGGPGFRPGDPKTRKAEEACREHLRFGGARDELSPEDQAKARDAFLAYARCMRKEGIDLPDPKPGQPGLMLRAGGPIDPESPRFRAADEVCRPALAQLRPPGPEVAR